MEFFATGAAPSKNSDAMKRVLDSIVDDEDAEEAEDLMSVDKGRAALPNLTPDSDEDSARRKKKEKKSKKEKKAEKKAAKEAAKAEGKKEKKKKRKADEMEVDGEGPKTNGHTAAVEKAMKKLKLSKEEKRAMKKAEKVSKKAVSL